MSNPSIYFYCCDEPENLQDDVVALAEGLRDLGITTFANCNYWLESTRPDDYLLRASKDVTPDDCDVVVVSHTWPLWVRMRSFDVVRRPLPEGLFQKGRRYTTVYLDNHDGHRTVSWEPDFRKFDLILRSKLNRRAWHPENMRPWVHGFTQRIISATATPHGFADRDRSVLINFGASHGFDHGSRALARKYFEPQIEKFFRIDRTKDDLSTQPLSAYDALMWEQTGGRFSRSYYERLKRSQAVACFCGELIPPAPFKDPERYLVGGGRARLQRRLFESLSYLDFRPRRSVQWDSFRFWEALCAGCLAFNLDLEYYGVELPEMPENWKHYIGVRLDRTEEMLDRLFGEGHRLAEIAASGQAWAQTHYSPAAMANRLLGYCGLQARISEPSADLAASTV